MANPTTVLSRAPPADPRAAPADAGKPASLVPDERTPEPAEARLRDGRELAGMLCEFSPSAGRLALSAGEGKKPRRIAFSELQWLKLARPVDAARNAEGFRARGIPVESLPACSAFSLTFKDGHVYSGELHGFGAAFSGLGIYLAGDPEGALRLFIPADTIESFVVGDRLGKLLLEGGQISAQGLELALERQRVLRKQRLGAVLLEHRLVTREQLERAVAGQARRPVQALGETLIAMGILTQAQLEMALAVQRANRRKPLGEVLIELQMLDRPSLQAALAQKLGVPFLDLRRFNLGADWGSLAPYPVCRDHRIVPLYRANGSVAVAIEDPLDLERLKMVSFALATPVIPVIASAEDIDWVLERHPERNLYETLAAVGEQGEAGAAPEEDAEALAARLHDEFVGDAEESAIAGSATLVKLVNKIILDAHRQKISDIHFEPGNGRERLRVRFRRDGALFDYLSLSPRFRPSIVSRLKIMASLDISEHRHAQDGKIDFKRYGGVPLELRMACIPTTRGLESVVLRLLAGAKPMALAQIGLSAQAFSRLRALAEKPYGLIVVCGPTGSGKTTTLHSLLAYLNTADNKIWTAEDPIEITQAGLNQVQVQPNIGWTFAQALRSFLRADPDIIMVGEVRDAETARIVVEASLTGHLVLTTLHTNSAPETVTRLVDMGLDPFNFADALLGVLAQRLVLRLCARCAHSEPADDAALAALADEYCAHTPLVAAEVLASWRANFAVEGAVRFTRPVGCTACNNTGFSGRLALYELLSMSSAIKQAILRRANVDEVRPIAIGEGMRTLRQDGIEKVLQGLTTIEQVRAASG